MLLQPSHFYDLCLLGLKWLSEARDLDEPRARSLSPVLYVLRDSGLITEKQRAAAMQDPRLRMKLRASLHLSTDTAGRTRQEDRDLQIASGMKRLVVMLERNTAFAPERLLARNGYKFYLGRAGLNYAATKEGPYVGIITRVTFVTAWMDMRHQLSIAMAAQEARRPKAIVIQGRFGAIELDHSDLEEVRAA